LPGHQPDRAGDNTKNPDCSGANSQKAAGKNEEGARMQAKRGNGKEQANSGKLSNVL
jgi:hypothetical protein